MNIEIIPIGVIADGKMKKTAIPINFIKKLTKEIREKGETYIHFNDGSSQKVEGFVVLGKDKKNYSLMLLPMEGTE